MVIIFIFILFIFFIFIFIFFIFIFIFFFRSGWSFEGSFSFTLSNVFPKSKKVNNPSNFKKKRKMGKRGKIVRRVGDYQVLSEIYNRREHRKMDM